VQFHCGVERGLSANGGQNGTWAFFLDNGFDVRRRDWLNVSGIGNVGAVIIVAGLEFTKITRRPSSRNARQACEPE